ncbi:MAG TPA: NAD-dependent succinate-semialdehyde dehydrogenase [Candidatus Acidoferrales bacterium]|nr:NAD-dependent succinate-semialdehyde dehydrogenase [Candidatus Acidoferrales bacterium]
MATQLASTYADLSLFIGGEWLTGDGRKTSPVINPATEEVIGHLPHASKADLDRALAEAERGFKVWRAIFPDQRGKILKRAADLMRERAEEIARVATTESGKSIHETRVEVQMSANIFEWFAEEGRRAYGRVLPQRAPGTRLAIVKEPVGVVAAFAPWNFPIGNPARKIGAALGAGCSCILKPAEETPAAGLAVAHCLVDAGLPAGVLSIVYGVPSEISEYLLASPIVRKISFTGSIPVGKQLMKLAAEGMKRTTMELGGHAPVLVFDDVDVEKVIDACATAKYRNAGQVCVSPTRFYVHEKIYNKFVEGFAARAKALPVGDGIEEKHKMGPLVHARRLAAVEALVDDAKKSGAKVQAGGARLKSRGYFYAPTVLSDVPNTARIMNEEPFGPVAVINSFSDYDAVIQQANRLPYGLAAFAFTNSAHRAKLVGEQLEAGMVGVNTFAISVPESPFGGVKESGHGSEEGIEGLEACLVTKFISEA